MANIPTLVDLVSFSKQARKLPGGAKLGEAVMLAHDAHIIYRNIQLATDLMNAGGTISQHFLQLPDEQRRTESQLAAIGQAVVGQAIMTYCRVTHGSGTLKKLPLTSLTAEQKATHQNVLNIRNEVFAHHVHKTKHVQGPWDRQFVLYVPGHENLPLRFPFLTSNWRHETVAPFQDLLAIVLALADDHQRNATIALDKELYEFALKTPGYEDFLEQSGLDPATFSNGILNWLLSDSGEDPFIEHVFDPTGQIHVPEQT